MDDILWMDEVIKYKQLRPLPWLEANLSAETVAGREQFYTDDCLSQSLRRLDRWEHLHFELRRPSKLHFKQTNPQRRP